MWSCSVVSEIFTTVTFLSPSPSSCRLWHQHLAHLQGLTRLDVQQAGHELWPPAWPIRAQCHLPGQVWAVHEAPFQLLWLFQGRQAVKQRVVLLLPETRGWEGPGPREGLKTVVTGHRSREEGCDVILHQRGSLRVTQLLLLKWPETNKLPQNSLLEHFILMVLAKMSYLTFCF